MKKVLIASTALVAAGLLSVGTASASEKIKLNLGGYSKWWVVGAWQDSDYENPNLAGGVQSASTNVDVKGDVEVFFGGKTTLDNGIEVGVDIQLEAGGMSAEGDTIDESYVWIAGGFGKAIIGTENNGVYLLHVTAPDAAGNWNEGGIIGGQWAVANPGVARIGVADPTNSTAIRAGNDVDKVTYVAPTFYGLTVGASYIPNANAGTSEDNATAAANVDGIPGYGVGALYANTFGGVGVKVSAGYVTYDASGTGAADAGASNEWSTGVNLSYAGFTLGGSYRKANQDEATGATTSADGDAFDVGLQYASGPYAVSVAYFKSSVDASLTDGDEDEIEIYQVSGKYTLGAGVDVLATVGHIDYQDEGNVATASNKGWVAMTGLSLAF